jgi:hypothetical protein
MGFRSMGSAALRCGLPSPCQRLTSATVVKIQPPPYL